MGGVLSILFIYTAQILIKNRNSEGGGGGLLPADIIFTVHRQQCQDLVV